MSEARPAPGAQTLARGLRALQLVALAPHGASIAEIADQLEVHRTIASRLLSTLADFKLIVRLPDGRYRVGSGIAALASGVHSTLRVTSDPILRDLAESMGATVTLLIAEGDEAVALAVIAPASSQYHLAFSAGGRHPIRRAAGGVALLAAGPVLPGEDPRVTEARDAGFASTFGEVEPGAYGVAVPIDLPEGFPRACLNLITHRAEIADASIAALQAASRQIATLLS